MKILTMIVLLCIVAPAWAAEIPDADSAVGQLYAERCSTCHALPHPKRLDWEGWRHMLGVMKLRMDEKGMQMDKAEWRQISAYVKTNAR